MSKVKMPAAQRPRVKPAALQAAIPFQLGRANDLLLLTFERRVNSRFGRFAVLSLIQENPGISQASIGLAIGRDKSTLAMLLKDLEYRDLVRRRRSPADGRAYHLTLTAAGEEHLRELARHAQEHDRHLTAIVGDAHRPLLIYLLERIAAASIETR